MNYKVDEDIFNTQPELTVVWGNDFYPEDKENGIVDISVCDSQCACLNNEQYDKWLKEFKNFADEGIDFEFTATMKFKLEPDLNFVLVSDSGNEVCHWGFGEFCKNHGISTQYYIDSPIMTEEDIDWNNIDNVEEHFYTGGAEEINVELIKILYHLQIKT